MQQVFYCHFIFSLFYIHLISLQISECNVLPSCLDQFWNLMKTSELQLLCSLAFSPSQALDLVSNSPPACTSVSLHCTFSNNKIKLYTFTVKHSIVFQPQWLLVSAIIAIISPWLYRNFKKPVYMWHIKCQVLWDPIYLNVSICNQPF